MEFQVTIECDNAAFNVPYSRPEIARILRQLAKDVEDNKNTPLRLRDINGNSVGEADFARKK